MDFHDGIWARSRVPWLLDCIPLRNAKVGGRFPVAHASDGCFISVGCNGMATYDETGQVS